MFTGIVEKLGTAREVSRTAEGLHVWIDTGFPDLTLGESVAVNGVCLTVAEFRPSSLHPQMGPEVRFFLSSETLNKTSHGALAPDQRVNLERALPANGRLSGHWVQGHVDGVGKIAEIRPIDECFHLTLELPNSLLKYCIQKGSICVDGISLTINELTSSGVELMIIPHTWENTHLQHLSQNANVNIEVDVLAKYVERLLQWRKF